MKRILRTRGSVVVATTVAIALLAACGGDDDPKSSTSSAAPSASASSSASAGGSGSPSASAASSASPEASASASESAPAAAAPVDPCAGLDAFGDIKGKTVTVYGASTDAKQKAIVAGFAPFEECTGAKVKAEGSQDFTTQIVVRAKAGTAPDIALFPNLGLLRTVAELGKIVDAPAEVVANIDQYYQPSWKDYGTIGGRVLAAPALADVKSFVWYSPKVFAEKGYTVPTTWDELVALSDKMAADDPKGRPWCAGFGSDAATGWVGTDWLEDMMLRVSGPQAYDKWISHEIPFNDPSVAAALEKVGSILKNDKYTNGGFGDSRSVATTTFQNGGLPILSGGCYLHRQAAFYGGLYPKGTKVAEDGDIFAFYLPAIDETHGKPVLFAGDFISSMTDKPETKALYTYMSGAGWVNAAAKAATTGGIVSPNKALDPSLLTSPVDKLAVSFLQDPKAVARYDASDLMPSAVGGGTAFKGLTDWVAGKSDKDTLDFIEQSWPK